MKRMNFIPKRRFTLWPDWSLCAVSDRTQDAFVACAAAIALLSLVGFLETQRIVQADGEHARANARLAGVERREADVRTVARALSSLGTVAKSVANTRGASQARLSEIARIGDVLPSGVWITEIGHVQQQIALKGRARDASLLGQALRNLSREHAFKNPQLISAREHADAAVHFIDFELSVGLGDTAHATDR